MNGSIREKCLESSPQHRIQKKMSSKSEAAIREPMHRALKLTPISPRCRNHLNLETKGNPPHVGLTVRQGNSKCKKTLSVVSKDTVRMP